MTADLKYGKILDLFDLALEMQERSDGISLSEIMSDFKCSRRTAVRMKDALLREFPAMEEVNSGEKIKRWRIPQQHFNSLISFSSEELSVFDTAVECLEKSGLDEKARILKTVALKVKNVINPKEKKRIEVDAEAIMRSEGIACRPGPKIIINKAIVENIKKAILTCNKIEIIYKKGEDTKKYKLCPYGFIYGGRNHYLLAKSKKDKLKIFVLTKIKEIEVLSETFVFDPNFSLDEYIKNSFGSYFEDLYDNEWVFDAKVANKAKKFLFHPNQEIIENKDGSLTVKFKASGILEMSWFLKTWGNKVKVISPLNFWKIAEEAQESYENE